jgi:hypothetical protein
MTINREHSPANLDACDVCRVRHGIEFIVIAERAYYR